MVGKMNKESGKTRFGELRKFISSKENYILAKGKNSEAFTRNRKMSLPFIIYSILLRKGKTVSMDLRDFFKKTGKDAIVSRQAYMKQRRKLNPEVFIRLNDFYLNEFYGSKEEVLTWKDYVVLAIDVSKAEIPNSEANRNKYGIAKNKEQDGCARALISGMYDVNNDFFLDLQIFNVNGSEKKAAENNIKALKRIKINHPVLIIFDRNYPSIEFMNKLKENNISFLIRLKSTDYIQERKSIETNDRKIELNHTWKRLYKIKKSNRKSHEKLKNKKSTQARLVKCLSPEGNEIAFITNLPENISTEEICNEYFKRWKIELAYNTLKNKMKFESVSGKSTIYVKQDFLAQILVYNLARDLMNSAEKELKNNQKKSKYPVRINENIALGVFREEFIELMMEDDTAKRDEKYVVLQKEMENYYLPKRKSDSKKRKFHPANKYASNLKPSF